MVFQSGQRTKGSSSFDADVLFEAWGDGHAPIPQNNDFRSSIIKTFNLPEDDSYVYHAIANVTLAQVQGAINHGAGSGLHAWYLDNNERPVTTPPI